MDKEEYLRKINEAWLKPESYFQTILDIEPPQEYVDKVELALLPEAEKNRKLPRWVRNLRKKINNSIFKIYQKLNLNENDDPYEVAFKIGAAREMREYLYENLAKFENFTGKKTDPSDLDEFEEEYSVIEEIQQKKEQALTNAPRTELAKYHKGMSEGLEAVLDDDGQFKGGKEDSKIALLLLMSWPIIQDTIKTRRELYERLRFWFGEKRIGDFKRMERMFERIKFSPAKPGRPRKE
jgi:hypothetical protein